MLKRELKVNFKSFLIWTLILMSLFLVIFLVYPSIINSEAMSSIDEMMTMFPPELLKAFNMDISSIDSAYGWLKTEGFVFVLLITGVYSGLLGTTILLKEENDGTIEYLGFLPISRTSIVFNKVLCAFIYIVLQVLILSFFNYIGLSLSGEFDQKAYLLLSFTPILSCIVIFSFCLFVSTFAHKTKKVQGVALGFVFMSYFMQVISELSNEVEFLKYISAFTLADIRHVIIEATINPIMIVISFILTLIFILLTIYHYNQKEVI